MWANSNFKEDKFDLDLVSEVIADFADKNLQEKANVTGLVP